MNGLSIGRLIGLVGFGLISCACGGTSTTPKGNGNSGGNGSSGSNGSSGNGGNSGSSGNSGSATVCAPGTRHCDGNELKRCDETGTAEVVDMTCSIGQCHEQGTTASCGSSMCTPSIALCDGNTATTCKLDGSGPQPGGVNCTASNKYCVGGTCQDTQCVGGTKSCQNGDVYLCAQDGMNLSLWQACADTEFCNDASHTCDSQLCRPGKSICSGTRVLTCNDSGSNWLTDTTDCANQSKVCVAGSCEARTCAPSTTFCKDHDLYQCAPDGTSSTLSQTCRPGFEHCEVTPAGLYAFCVPDACVAGNKLCDGDVIKICNDDGSVPADGTACAKTEYCENAQCKPRDCELGTAYCKDNNVYTCEPSGPSLSWQCNAGEGCVAIVPNADPSYPDLVNCSPSPCTPGGSTCVQNQIGSCAADGTSLGAVTTDCAAGGMICTTAGKCAAAVTDTVGLDESAVAFQAGPYVGNVIEVRSARKLTELQMWLVFTSSRDLRWMVFEQVADEFVPRAEVTTTIANSTGFVSSGALSFNYQLEVGKRYALGVMMPGDSIGYEDSQPVAGHVSFGTQLGSVMAYGDFTNFSAGACFVAFTAPYMKVMTAP